MQPENQNPITIKPKKCSKLPLIIISIICILLAGFSAWAFLTYKSNKNTIDSQISDAVATAKKEQADVDEQKIVAYENELTNEFVGPEDYGRVTFDYPRIWSVYVNQDGSDDSDYEAYFNPSSVPPVSDDQQFALRMTIEDTTYDKVISNYSKKVKDGDLSSSSITIDDVTGTRLDGKFSDDIRGSAVIFKIRDKTLTIRTDADTFKDNFESIIQTIKFNE